MKSSMIASVFNHRTLSLVKRKFMIVSSFAYAIPS